MKPNPALFFGQGPAWILLLACWLFFVGGPPPDACAGDLTNSNPPPPASQGNGTTPLRDLILRGLVFNPEIQASALDPRIAAQQIRKEMAAFEPSLEAVAGHEYTKKPLNTQELLATGLFDTSGADFNEGTSNYSLGLLGKLPLGTEYDLSFKGNRYDNDLNATSPSSIYYPEYDSFAGLTITQPLFRGGGTAANLAPVRIARADERIAVLQRSRKSEELALDITLRYCDLAFAYSDIGVREEGLRLAETFREDSLKRLEQGIGANVDVLEAESAAANRADELELGIARMIEVQTELRKLTADTSDESESAGIIPSATGFFFGEPAPREDLISAAFMNRLDYQQAKIEVEKQDIQIKYAKNQKWPKVDLKASGGVLGLESDVGGSITSASTGDNPFWSVGILVSIPLGGSEADSQLKTARMKKTQSLLALKKIEQQIVIEIDGQLRILKVHRKRVESSRKAVEVAARLLRAEEKKLREGTSTGYNVLEAQRNLTGARTQELSAINNYNQSAARLSFLRGTLLGDVGLVATR